MTNSNSPKEKTDALRGTTPMPQRKKYFRAFLFGLFAIAGIHLLGQPRWLFSLAARIWPGALYAVSTRDKVVALTIDDGPGTATPEILDVLNRYDAKATFFNISSHVSDNEAAIRQTVAAGHELGNHLTVDEASLLLGDDEFEAKLLTAENVLEAYLAQGETLRWLRPGMGLYDAEMVKAAEQHGYDVVLGSNFPYDTHVPVSEFVIAFILHTLQPGDVIVLHDGDNNRGDRTARTLEKLLPALQSRGYTVTTLSELVK